MRTTAVIALALLLLPTLAAGAQGDRYVNVSGPEFLKPYGPHDPRIDNPLAAGITAVVVAGVIYRGIRLWQREQESGD